MKGEKATEKDQEKMIIIGEAIRALINTFYDEEHTFFFTLRMLKNEERGETCATVGDMCPHDITYSISLILDALEKMGVNLEEDKAFKNMASEARH